MMTDLSAADSDAPAGQPRSFVAAARGFGAGDDPRRFLERSLEILDGCEQRLRAFTAVDAEGARRQADASAARWRDGRPLSPVDGMPVGIKDVIETADMPTGMGSPLFEGWRSGRDAACVAALREAGAVVFGKTVTTEFAATEPGPTRNPRDYRRTPGGSSSGSAAAVAAGILPAALGTQVIGSIIRPAGYCGCIGFKPTVGALNRGGCHDYLSQSALGVLAATLDDASAVATAIAQRAGGDPGHAAFKSPGRLPRRPRAVALLETAGWPVRSAGAGERLRAVLDGLAGEGVRIVDRSTSPLLDEVERDIADALTLSQTINAWEFRWPLNTYAARAPRLLSAAMTARLRQAERMNVGDYEEALAKRERIRSSYGRLAQECDACLTLSAPAPAPLGIASTGNPAFAVPASLLGAPALSLPLIEDDGLPVGLQMLGFSGCDDSLFAVAAFVAQQRA